MTAQIKKASEKSEDAMAFRRLLQLHKVSSSNSITIDSEMAEVLGGLRNYIDMIHQSMSFIEKLIFKIEMRGGI